LKFEGAKTIGEVSQKAEYKAKNKSPCPIKVGVPVLGPSL
jgi:hypothetical protein